MSLKESLDYVYKMQRELSLLGGIGALLGWDQKTYMPSQGASDRAEQLSWVSRVSHEKVVSDALWDHIQRLSDHRMVCVATC